MNNFDLRLCVPFLINSLKSLVALPGNDDWDPFYAIDHLTWIKLCLFLLILALFSFTSINIEVPYTASVHTSSAICVRLRLGVFSLPITLSFIASLFFPQTLFWYTYPILVLAPFWSPWLLHILLWVRAMASTIPVYDIIIIKVSRSRQRQVTGVEANEPYLQQEEPSSEDEDLEANIVIVAQQLNMYYFDLRLCVPFLINSLKSLVALPGNDDWDPFYAIDHLTWIKWCLFLLILALFSFTPINIEVPYTASVHTSSASYVRLRLGVFSLPITLSFMASLFFPQTLFWYTYPILVLAPFWSPWLLHILLRVRAMASTIPVYDIIIIKISGSRQRQVTGVEANEPYLQQEEPSSEDEDLEANIVIVAPQV